jgi:hypothetical protein
MKKYSWAVEAFDFYRKTGGAHLLQIEEAEDGVSTAIELLKQARHSGGSAVDVSGIDEILHDMSGCLDKIRKLRDDLKRKS